MTALVLASAGTTPREHGVVPECAFTQRMVTSAIATVGISDCRAIANASVNRMRLCHLFLMCPGFILRAFSANGVPETGDFTSRWKTGFQGLLTEWLPVLYRKAVQYPGDIPGGHGGRSHRVCELGRDAATSQAATRLISIGPCSNPGMVPDSLVEILLS